MMERSDVLPPCKSMPMLLEYALATIISYPVISLARGQALPYLTLTSISFKKSKGTSESSQTIENRSFEKNLICSPRSQAQSHTQALLESLNK